MAEKVAGKKEDQQHGNKKSNKNQQQQQQQKKKQVETNKALNQLAKKVKKNNNNNNGSSNNQNSLSNNHNNNSNQNKKNKEKKYNKNQSNKNQKKNINKGSSGGICRTVFKLCFFTVASVLMFLGFLYIVDMKKYRSVVQGGENALNGVKQYLPVEVVVQGEKMYSHYVRPTVEVAVDKVLVLVNQTSTVLNTNPALKDHWSNINEISAVIGERLAEYMRTVYKQIPIYYDYARNKLF